MWIIPGNLDLSGVKNYFCSARARSLGEICSEIKGVACHTPPRPAVPLRYNFRNFQGLVERPQCRLSHLYQIPGVKLVLNCLKIVELRS
jgi:hypothetical protein